MATPASFPYIFCVFIQTIQFYNKLMQKYAHPVSGAGIRTHNLLNTSLLPKPLDHGSR